MPLNGFAKKLRRFGVLAAMHHLSISVINRIIKLRVLVIYVKQTSLPLKPYPNDILIRLLTNHELKTIADTPGLELPECFIDEAIANGDECFGAFIQNELSAYGWYATQPSKSADETIAVFNSDYVYTYKDLTLPSQRGHGVQKLIKEFTFEHYHQQGKRGIIVGIDSINFSSRASIEGSGALKVGYCAYIKRGSQLINLRSNGAKRFGFKLINPSDAVNIS